MSMCTVNTQVQTHAQIYIHAQIPAYIQLPALFQPCVPSQPSTLATKRCEVCLRYFTKSLHAMVFMQTVYSTVIRGKQ